MPIIITPNFEDIFNVNQTPIVSEFLKGISTKTALAYIANIDCELYIDDSLSKQIIILKELLVGQDIEIVKKIFSKYVTIRGKYKPNEVAIFSRLHIKEFMHYVILNCNNGELQILDSSQRFNFFKAYLLLASQNNINLNNIIKANKNDFFNSMTWPLYIQQVDQNQRTDPFPSLIRALCFLNQFQFNSNKYKKSVENFLEYAEKSNTWEYIFTLLNSFVQQIDKKNDYHSILQSDESYNKMFNNFSINIEEYKTSYKDSKGSFIGLKSKPLLKINQNYVVLDWNYFINKIYEGLLFEFLTNSQITDLTSLKSIPDLKREIGDKVTENFLFRNLFKEILFHRYGILNFDEGNGGPDAYFRKGNKIVVIEIKDAFFPGNAIESCDYNTIKDAVDKKYNDSEKNKGVDQLVNEIGKIAINSLEDKSYDDLKIKPRNFKIYPVLLYTDQHFGMPGLSNYLKEQFSKKISDRKITDKVKKIEDLTFLNLDTVIRLFDNLRDGNFIEMIERLHNEIRVKEKKHRQLNQLDLLFDYHDNMDRRLENICDEGSSKNYENLINLLNLKEGLPAGS